MSTPHTASSLYLEDGITFLRVTAEHAIAEHWLTEHAADLYTAWQAAPDGAARDHIATLIDDRFTDLVELPPPAPPDRPPSPEPIRTPELVLAVMIEEYETRLIAQPDMPRANDDRHAVDHYIDSHKLHRASAVVEMRHRDWADHSAPALYVAWQRAVVADGELAAGQQRMSAIITGHSWATRLEAIDPALSDPTYLPVLASALQRATRAGYSIDDLQRLARRSPLPAGREARELHHRLIQECDAALPEVPTRAPLSLVTSTPRRFETHHPSLHLVPTPRR